MPSATAPKPWTAIPADPFVSFLGLPAETDLHSLDAAVAVLGVPYAIPYAVDQVRSGIAPDYLRRHSSRVMRAMGNGINFERDCQPINLSQLKMVDCGNIVSDPMDPRVAVERTTAAIKAIVAAGAVPLVFGGDDAVPIPVARGLAEAGPLTVIQIDQHMDFADERHGVREGYSSPMRRIAEMPWVRQSVQIGLHSYGTADQVEAARAAGNLIFTEAEVHRRGVADILGQLPDGENYFITIDLDGFDASVMPAVSHPEPGGLTYAEARELLCGLAAKGRIVAVDWVEMVPEHDWHGQSAYAVCRLITQMLHAMQQSGQLPSKTA